MWLEKMKAAQEVIGSDHYHYSEKFVGMITCFDLLFPLAYANMLCKHQASLNIRLCIKIVV